VIAHVAGTLLAKALDRVEVMTAGGVGYELSVPLSVYETLPKLGENVRLHTYLVVKEDGWQLFGFSTAFERQVFQRVLDAKGVGPALALGLLSTLSAERLVRAIRERDIVTLQSVPRVGRKKAEQLVLDLADKLDDVQVVTSAGVARSEGPAAEDAIRALVSLGYSMGDAERAVKGVLDDGGRGMSAPELIRRALAKVGGGNR
jgi:Holliday junction DNA helicase RuvA